MKTINVSPKDKEVICAVMDAFPDGAGIQAIRQSIRVIDKVAACGETLDLEDADMAYLRQRFSAAKFVRADRDILGLFERIETA